MDPDAVVEWMKQVSWGVPHWALVAFGVFVVLERFLGRSKNPQVRSFLAAAAMGVRKILEITRVGKIPVLGVTLMMLLEIVSGADIDGDGRVGDPGK